MFDQSDFLFAGLNSPMSTSKGVNLTSYVSFSAKNHALSRIIQPQVNPLKQAPQPSHRILPFRIILIFKPYLSIWCPSGSIRHSCHQISRPFKALMRICGKRPSPTGIGLSVVKIPLIKSWASWLRSLRVRSRAFRTLH